MSEGCLRDTFCEMLDALTTEYLTTTLSALSKQEQAILQNTLFAHFAGDLPIEANDPELKPALFALFPQLKTILE